MAKREKKQQSSIDRLPDDVREKLQELLRDPRVTQLAATRKINAVLETEGHDERVSKSAVNRYDLQMRQVGEKLQQSREMAEMWIGKLGSKPQGQIGNLVNEMLRTLSFDAAIWLQEGEINQGNAEGVIDMANSLALTMQRLEKASNLNVAREKEIRQQALADAAVATDEVVEQLGLTEEQADFWRKKVLGAS